MDKHLLFQGFRQILSQPELPGTAQAVVVLSGSPIRDSNGNVTSEYSPENITRIAFGVQTVQLIAAKKGGKSLKEVSFGDGPFLVLNGDEMQLDAMEEIAKGFGFPADRTLGINCGKREVSNTKTQFEVMKSDAICNNFRDVIYITHDYHTLRVALTAKKYLPADCHYVVLPVLNGYRDFSYNKFKMFRKEIGKIQQYADRGDIARLL
jgi:uncharacterized SAM-binding protein YcdF (DUF218 family)